jgi:hypothetical protein
MRVSFSLRLCTLGRSAAHSRALALFTQVGDIRVRFAIVHPTTVSIVGEVAQRHIEPHVTDGGESVLLLNEGRLSARAQLAMAGSSNSFVSWLLRGLGTTLTCVGFHMMLRVLQTLSEPLPIVRDLLSLGTVLVASAAGITLSTGVIATAWLVRPLLLLCVSHSLANSLSLSLSLSLTHSPTLSLSLSLSLSHTHSHSLSCARPLSLSVMTTLLVCCAACESLALTSLPRHVLSKQVYHPLVSLVLVVCAGGVWSIVTPSGRKLLSRLKSLLTAA